MRIFRKTGFFQTGSGLLFLFSLLLGSAPSSGAVSDISESDEQVNTAVAYVESVIADFMKEEEVAGISIGLIQGNNTIWTQGYGVADEASERAFTDHTENAMHELAKLFTAVSVMQLVESGGITLDAPFSDYFPDFRPYRSHVSSDRFTIRQLLMHHSGLPSQYGPGFELTPDDAGLLPSDWSVSYRQILDQSDNLAFVTEPGELYGYSYLGYTLLGLLIEKVSGMTYADYVREHIFDPLGMDNTRFGWLHDSAYESEVDKSYAFSDGDQQWHSAFRDLPANGLVSTAHDMSRFIQALITGGEGLLSIDTLEEMFRVQNDSVSLDGTFKIGLGFFTTPTTGGVFREAQSISHGADIGIGQSFFLALPEEQLGVFVTSNTDVGASALRELTDNILTALLPSEHTLSLTPYIPHSVVPLDREKAGTLEGSYSGAAGMYEVELRRKNLKLLIPQLPVFNITLLPRAEDFYGVKIKLFGFISLGAFSFIAEMERNLEAKMVTIGDENLMQWYYRGTATFVTLSSITPSGEAHDVDSWKRLVGEYTSETADGDIELVFDEKRQVFQFGRKPGLLGFNGTPAQVYCGVTESELHHCGKGLDPPGFKNLIRKADSDTLVDAYGHVYSRIQ